MGELLLPRIPDRCARTLYRKAFDARQRFQQIGLSVQNLGQRGKLDIEMESLRHGPELYRQSTELLVQQLEQTRAQRFSSRCREGKALRGLRDGVQTKIYRGNDAKGAEEPQSLIYADHIRQRF